MESFVTLEAIAAPLPRRNVNTDDIFPSLKGVAALTDPGAMGSLCFANWRWRPDGAPIEDFVLNRPPYDRARILVAGANFGCGSSREAAVWCMAAIGLRCVIAPSFGDIFHGNCLKNGMLPIRLDEAEVDTLLALISSPESATLAIDLEQGTIRAASGLVLPFAIGSLDRERLLSGKDDIEMTLAGMGDILAFETRYRARRPWLAIPRAAH